MSDLSVWQHVAIQKVKAAMEVHYAAMKQGRKGNSWC
jgi:hypothetical protein